MAESSPPKTPSTPTDMDISEWELSSCSTSTSMATACSTSGVRTPISMVSMLSVGTEQEAAEEAMQISGSSTKASEQHIPMELELQELDTCTAWPKAYLEIADHCHDYPYHMARALENRPRNRYQDVNPYDHSRVLLGVACPAPDGRLLPGLGLSFFIASRSSYDFSTASWTRQGEAAKKGDLNDYINANFVVVDEAQRSYILTQCPLPNTYAHFWLMVWQQNSRAVIMLSPLMEDPTQCSPYYPINQGQRLFFEEVGLSVHLLRKDVEPFHTVHYLSLENMMTGEFKPVSHFHYTNWPDIGVPESPAAFLSFLFMLRGLGHLSYMTAPVVIHCTGGIGRSGVFTLIDTCLILMMKRENPFSLNIRQVLVKLRKYRMGLVQTAEELRFAYVAVIEGAKFLMGDESIKKKWGELTMEDHTRSFNFYSSELAYVMLNKRSNLPRVVLKFEDDDKNVGKDEEKEMKPDYSDLAVRMPDSEEESSGTGAQKGDEDECKPSTSRDGNQESGRTSKTATKRKRVNLF